MKSKICIICNKEFTPRNSKQLCCCKECSKQLEKQRKQKKHKENYIPKEIKTKFCKVCNKEFKPNSSRNNQKYCCEECKQIGYKLKAKEYSQTHKKPSIKQTYTTTCLNCGKTFVANRKGQKYCCKECNQLFQNKQQKELRKQNKKPFIKICEYCGKEFETITNKYKYCSDLCNSRAFAKRHKVTLPSIICPICKQEFTPTRINQTICNSEKCKRQYAQNYLNKRYKNNPEFRLGQKLRGMIRRCLSLCYDTQKKDHTFTILGYTPNDLKQHLEKQFKNGMNWGNQGTYWEIDHIKEVDTFNFILPNGETDYEQIKLANSLENLQPLTIEEHRKKSVEYRKSKHL